MKQDTECSDPDKMFRVFLSYKKLRSPQDDRFCGKSHRKGESAGCYAACILRGG